MGVQILGVYIHVDTASCGIYTLRQLFYLIAMFIPDPSALPQVATCFNTIILPHYPSKKILNEKLYTALEYGSLSFGRH